MKIKLLLTIILSLNSLFINAQRVIEKTNLTTSEHKRTNIDINNINKNFIHMSNLKTNENRIHAAYKPFSCYFYNLSGYVNYYLNPLFYDSLAVYCYTVNGNLKSETALAMGVGNVIDPTSYIFDQSSNVDYQGHPLPNLRLCKDEKYTLDTIEVPAIYQRVSSPDIVDTLIVQVVYGDTTDQGNLQKTPFSVCKSGKTSNIYASPLWSKSLDGLRGAIANNQYTQIATFKKLLTNADSNRINFTFKTALDIKAGNIFGALVTYRSGLKTQNGDIFYSDEEAQNLGKIQNHNSFVMLCLIPNNGNNNAFYDKNTFTCPYILSIPTKYGLYDNIQNNILYPTTYQIFGINYIITVPQVDCNLIIDAGENQTIEKGDTTTLTATGSSDYKYYWFNNNNSSKIAQVSPTITTTYTVTAILGSCSATDNVIVTIKQSSCALSVNAGFDQVITKGGTATLTAIATGGTNYNYSWSNNSTSSSTIVNPTQTTTYTVIVNNGSCSASDNVVIAVNPAGCNLSVNAGNDQTIGNSPITLTATPTGGNNYTYSWSNGAGSSQQVNVNPSATTTYCVTVVSGNCSAMDNVIISVTGTTGINTTIKQIEQTFDIYPNPFNDKTSIHFNLIKSEHVTINIYDLIGNKVTTLVNEVKTAGEHIIDLNRNTINPGVYFIEYKSGENKILKKIVLL